MYNLDSLSKNTSSWTKVDAIRFKNYFSYMLKTNRNKNIYEIVRAFKATVEYPFNNHDFCDETWYISLKKGGKGKRSLYNHFTVVKKITISFIIKSGIAIELIHHPLYSKNHFITLTPNKTRQ